MKQIMQFSDQELLQWLKNQLEKREIMYGERFGKEQIKEELYKILYSEQQLTVEEIEYFFIPFGQSGYLSPRCKFELMLFILEKDYGQSFLFLEGDALKGVITEEDVEKMYLQWLLEERLWLSDEEKKEFFIQTIMDRLGLGVLDVLKRMAIDGVLLGEFCPARHESESVQERVAVYLDGEIIRFPFLQIECKEELIRIIRYAIAMENQGDLTMVNPILDFVREDGTCITAVRPPAGKDWGIRILYSAAGKEGMQWGK